ncbi:ABC transporter F family member 4-like [Cimex lectularius]|uniref:Uncharacterized protein n=1 Tax=Cimex lectularius TaxID=79782 RepID=A0A8I6RRB1_CIMLE|nr:ABC transporter F family member 4-like [Cimex lectularius]XP_014248711.1 ABC transporter F family member 4-like [Cimex lectularius]
MPPKKVTKAKKGAESDPAPVVSEEENGVEETHTTEETEEDVEAMPKQKAGKRRGAQKEKNTPPPKKSKAVSPVPKGKTATDEKATKKGTKKAEDTKEEEQTEENEDEKTVEKPDKNKGGKKPKGRKAKGDGQENGADMGTRPKREAFQKAVELVATNKRTTKKIVNRTKQNKPNPDFN